MTRRLLPLLAILTFIIAFSSCTKDKKIYYGSDATTGYYPLTVGRFVLYDVDSIVWGETAGGLRAAHYQMRYTIEDTLMDAQNRRSFRIQVLIRNSDSSQWRTSDVFLATPTAASLEVLQNNLRFTKLVFPVANGTTWMGNSAIPAADQDLSYFDGWKYNYTGLGQPYNDGRTDIDNTVTVNETDETLNDPDANPTVDYAYRTFSKEIYGYDVGLVYRELVHWTYQYNNSSTIPNGRVGYSVVMRAVDHN